MTTQNGNYSLEGAEFGVYKEASFSGSSRVGVLKTDAKGDSNVLSLQAGTYFVKEIKAPKGYALNPETKTVTISSGRESKVMFEDVPQLTEDNLGTDNNGEELGDKALVNQK